MADESTNVYTLSQVTQIVGVDEKTLHLYAHKGLIDPTLLNDSATRFTEVDCARLTVIKRANELGYESENIFNLIGSPDEVMNADDPVSACQQFAMKKYKEIFNELGDCEPLEQLNKKCDLKLLKNYIMNLEGRKEGSPHSFHPANNAIHPFAKEMNEHKKMPRSSPPHEDGKQTPKVLSYSVDKLWDYVNKSDLSRTDDALSEETLLDEQQQGVSRKDETGDEMLSEMPMQRFKDSPPIDRLMKSRWWPTGDDEYKTLLTKPAWRNWIFSILIVALAITGLVKVFGTGDKAPQQQITAEAESPGATTDQAPIREPDGDKPYPSGSETDQPAPRDPTAGSLGRKESPSPLLEESLSEPDADVEPEAAPRVEDAPAQTVAAIEKPVDAGSATQTDQPESQPPSPIEVKNLSLWHDSLNKIYRAELIIQKNNPIVDKAPISGYAFVHLVGEGEEGVDSDGLLMPEGELSSGIPSKIRQGASFSIKNLIQMRIKAVSELAPNDVSSGRVLVFSSEGILLLEQAFNVPIQPFFTASEASTPPPPPVAEKTETIEPDSPSSETTVESEAPVAPEPPATAQDTIATPPAEEIPDVAVKTQPEVGSASVEPSTPKVPVVTPPVDGVLEPIGNLNKTDHPDAAIWEQKSYDAAINGDFDVAIAHATKAIELDPGRVNPYINRSWAYIEQNMLQRAIRDCKAALQIDPKNMLAYNNRGLAYQRMAEFTRAQEDYGQACDLGLELGCQNLEGLTHQTRTFELIDQSQAAFKAKDWVGVIRATTKVIELDPQNAVAFTNRSAAYAQMSDLVKALKDSNEAIRHNPDFPLAYNNRGYVFELLGNRSKAAADYLKSCSLGLNLGCKNYDKLN